MLEKHILMADSALNNILGMTVNQIVPTCYFPTLIVMCVSACVHVHVFWKGGVHLSGMLFWFLPVALS